MTNHETNCVKLWIDNDKGLYLYWKELAEEIKGAYDLAQQLKDWLEEERPELDGMWLDLMSAALSEVNHYEIAESMLRDIAAESCDEGDNMGAHSSHKPL